MKLNKEIGFQMRDDIEAKPNCVKLKLKKNDERFPSLPSSFLIIFFPRDAGTPSPSRSVNAAMRCAMIKIKHTVSSQSNRKSQTVGLDLPSKKFTFTSSSSSSRLMMQSMITEKNLSYSFHSKDHR